MILPTYRNRGTALYCGCVSLFAFIPVWVFVAGALVAGLVLGSFLNVCIARLPAHQSIVTPPSHCPHCGMPIRPRDNVPVLSWLWLRGRCRACKARISLQYPLVELGTAALFLACVFHTGATWQTLIDAATCFLLLGLAVMDWQTMLLPDAFTLTGIGAAFLLKVFAPGNRYRLRVAMETLEAAAIAAALLLLVWALYRVVRRREGLGLGDVKLLAMMAAFMGLPMALFSYFVGVLAAALFAVVLLARGKARGSDRIPFGSFLAGAGIAAIFIGRPLIAWYLPMFR
jgi:leader peptidase (prepilin peptidase) / N-methyltransferase